MQLPFYVSKLKVLHGCWHILHDIGDDVDTVTALLLTCKCCPQITKSVIWASLEIQTRLKYDQS